jgi:pilus assembly protein CpaE
MSRRQGLLSIGIFNAEQNRTAEFRDLLKPMQDVRFAGVAFTWEELQAKLADDEIDILLANLDPNLEIGFEIVQRALRASDQIAVIGISRTTDPQMIIRAMRSGCVQYVCSPVDIKDLSNAIYRVRQTHFGTSQNSKRICVLGATGGAGATTIACNLAMELASFTGQSVGLVDLNIEFGDINCALNLDPKYTISDLCRGEGDMDRAMVQSAMHEMPSKVAILSCPRTLIEGRHVTADGIYQLLMILGSLYSHVVVDMPRSLLAETAHALEGADMVLLVTQLSVPSVRNATRIMEFLQSAGAPDDAIKIVLNRAQSDHGNISVHDVEVHFNRPVFAKIPSDYKHVISALNLGHPIATQAPASAVRVAIQGMAQRIALEGHSGEETDSPKGGLVGRLFKGK